ncbi:unnamed protein product [Oikopleura dioica]|uniref:Cep57 centrosome localisation domain-containing protein n=1 Tax=Oikopleura dioica TaxID=34765 RepID=E4YZ60_OIKDI|nr:unnamed protein product [Oikopleura dioica]
MNSPRGIPESNGRAVISALRSLQGKIKSMERERSQSNASSTVTTPRLPAGELPIMKRFIARSRSLSTDATTASLSEKTDSCEKKSENQSKILEDELSQADERCRNLEEKLNNMRLAFVKAETERNKEKEARIRSERERIAAIYAKSEEKQQTPISINRHLYEVAPFSSIKILESDSETEADMPLTQESENEENDIEKILKKNRKKSKPAKRKNPSPPTKSPKSIDRERVQFPFCAGSASKSHNVGLNLQGLMHQVKTQSSRRGPQQAEMTSSKASTKRRTVSQEHTHDTVKTKELENLTTLLSELQKEFAELATSCRQTDLDCEDLQEKLKMMEKKGQHILVVKKFLKQKKSKQATKEEDLPKSMQSSQRKGGVRPAQNRAILREVRKLQNAIHSDQVL